MKKLAPTDSYGVICDHIQKLCIKDGYLCKGASQTCCRVICDHGQSESQRSMHPKPIWLKVKQEFQWSKHITKFKTHNET